MAETRLDEYFICGGFGGTCAVLIGHPFDTIKVRLQTMPAPKPGETALYSGPWNCFQKSLKSEGVSGLFKGMGLPLMFVAPIFAVSFLTYGIGKQMFGPPDGGHVTPLQTFAAGSFSGIFSSMITSPGERIKCLLQVQRDLQSPKAYSGPVDCARKLYRTGGFTGIYRGLGATLLREIPSNGFYFMTYEVLKKNLLDDKSELTKNLVTIFAGGAAGISYWLTGLPADIIKSRLQTAPEHRKTTFGMVFKELIHTEGFGGLYKGLSPVMIRAFVANAACFLGFEVCKQFLEIFRFQDGSIPSADLQPVFRKSGGSEDS